jgi:signal transduction histidine kinase
LVVDDNASNLLAIKVALEGLDANIVQAQSGPEALRHLLARDFALVLLDVQMPSMDGFETARLIRQRERNRHTPIIFVTAFDHDREDALQAYAMGAVDFLFKPIHPQIVRAKASVLISLQRRTEEVAEQAALLRQQERRLHQQELAEQERRWEQEALRRQMEEKSRVADEMARRTEELKRTVAERQATEEQLTLINRRLEESDRRKDEFLAVLAHELRNPLAPIMTSIDLLEMLDKNETLGPKPDRGKARAVMRRQVQHLIRLVDDLLDVSRINSGKIELRKELLDLTSVVEQAVETSRHLLNERTQALTLDLAEVPITLRGDAVRLTQIVANLLNNAARYTPQGGQIAVSTSLEAGQAVIRVRDTGQGIPEDMLESIFDTFVQFRAKGGGLGLGLTLVKRLVELHGGMVSARSFGSNCGSEFIVLLPAVREVASDVVAVEDASTVLAPMRLVVIEDNEDIREMMSLLLCSLGHTVEVAARGIEGVELCIALEPEAAVVDIGLDDIDGYAVAERIRAAMAERAPYMIAMTGFGQERDRKRAFEAGFQAHLIKPATAEAIARVLANVRAFGEARVASDPAVSRNASRIEPQPGGRSDPPSKAEVSQTRRANFGK